MAEIGNSLELRPGISENESLALQILTIVFGFVTQFYITSLAIDSGVKLSTVIVYATLTYYFWNLYKGILGRPNVFKRRGEPIKLVNFAVYLFVGFTGLMVAISLYHSVFFALDINIDMLIPIITGILAVVAALFAALFFTLLYLSLSDYEGRCITMLVVTICTTALIGVWYLLKAVRGAFKASKFRENPDMFKKFIINLLVAITALSAAWYANESKETVISQFISEPRYACRGDANNFICQYDVI